jgi:uncharacterized protein DUF3352/tetratricopeptide repeat protein
MQLSNRAERRSRAGRISASVLALVAFFLVASLALSPLLQASEFEAGSVRLESLVPDDCYFFATFGGVDHCVRNAEALGLHQLWEEPEVQAFAKNLVSMVRAKVERPGLPISKVLDLVRGRVSIAIGDQTLVAGVVPVPAFVLGVDTGNKTAAFRESWSMLLDGLLSGTGETPTRSTFKYRDWEITDMHSDRAKASLCWTYVDSLFLVGLNKYYLERVLNNVGASNAKTLERHEAFRRTQKKFANPDSTLFAYVNFQGFTNKLGPWMPPEALEYLDLFGVGSVDAIALGSVPAGSVSREIFYVDAPGEKAGLLRILAPRPSGMKALAFAPPETAVFLSATVDVQTGYQEAMRILRTIHEPTYRQVQEHLHQMESQVGLSLEKDIVAGLGGEISLYAGLPAGGGMIPDVVAVVGVKDRAAFERCLAVPLAMAPQLEFKTLEYEGAQVKYLGSRAGGLPVTPAYAIVDDLMVVGTSPNSVKQVIHSRTEKRPSLADNPEFQAARARLVAKNPSCFEYVDVKRIVTSLYATASPFLQGVQGHIDAAGLPLDMALLPTVDTLSKHLSAAASAWSSDEDGILAEGVSPIGLGALVSLGFAAAASLDKASIPDLRRERVASVHAEAPRARDSEETEAPAPTSPPPAVRIAAPAPGRDADRYFAAKDWAKAASAYDKVVTELPSDGRAWFNLGFSLHNLGKYDQSIPAFEKAADLEPRQKALSYFNVACGYSLKKEKDRAFEWLRKALDAGLNPKQLEGDPDLESLRSDARFGELTKKVY